MILASTAFSPCSVCGSRTTTADCRRCVERAIAMSGTPEDRVRFEQEETERLARLDQVRLTVESSSAIDVALVGSGVPRSVALVGCGKAKLKTSERVTARELYVGNPFKMSFQYALHTSDDVQIISALHGVLSPYELVAPYEFSMAQMFVSKQREWGLRVIQSLKALYPMTHLRLVFYAGRQYIRPIVGALTPEDRHYWTIEDPLQGLDLFQRIRWLKAHLTPFLDPATQEI